MTVFDELNDPKACERHLARLRDAFPELGCGAFLVRDTSNIQWLTAFDDVFDEEAAHALYVCPDHAWLHTDSRYVTACENAARLKPLEVSAERETHAQFAAKRWGGRPSGAADALLGIEDGVSLAEYRRLQKAFAEADAEEPFVETDGVVVGLRAVKDRYEIARMRGAQSITDAAFEHIVCYMRPGMTERQVQLELEEFMLRHGAQGLAFPSIVATGPNGASPHAIPGATMLEAGQCVVLDFGARSYGYCSDMTRTVAVDHVTDEMRLVYDTVLNAQLAGIACCKAGVTGRDVDAAGRRIIEQAGYGDAFGHGFGHGVGLEIHEAPTASPRGDSPLPAGSIVTAEPGIYLPGRFGVRIEDMLYVIEDGCIDLTDAPKSLLIL